MGIIRKKIFRSAPGKGFENPFLDQLLTEMEVNSWSSDNFECWKLSALLKNRTKVSIIHYHWPESFWRSNFYLLQCFKCCQFIISVIFAKILGYKLVWSAHNILPHYKVKSIALEIFMRKLILYYFDLVIGHSKNVSADLINNFGTDGNKYILAIHGIYSLKDYKVKRNKKEIRASYGVKGDEKFILLFGGSSDRLNKNELSVVNYWNNNETNGLKLFFKTSKNTDLNGNNVILHFNRLSEIEMAELFYSADYLILPYTNITTSGMFFLSVTFDLPVIAPDIPFFEQHVRPQTAILYGKKRECKSLSDAINLAMNGWCKNSLEFTELKDEYSWSNSAKIISSAFDEISVNDN